MGGPVLHRALVCATASTMTVLHRDDRITKITVFQVEGSPAVSDHLTHRDRLRVCEAFAF